VGFDPRGVGRSAPVTCLSDAQLDRYLGQDPTPDTPAEADAVVTGDKTFDAGCQARSAWLLPYVGTPNAARDMDVQPHPVHYAGSPPILVLGTIHDPATLYPGAQLMAQQLGAAVLLTYNGDGHTTHGRGSTCIDTAVATYLVQGTAPAAGVVCQPDFGPA
jgi:TAP-like protein